MTSDRTYFFGKIPQKSVSKKGHNRPVPDRRFQAFDCGTLEVRFTNTTATQFGGYPLWAAFLDRFKLNAKLAQHIKMNRGEGFTAPELSRFFIDCRILGADRLMHVDAMRHDPMITNAYGIDGLPSNVTLGRYFEEFREGHIASLDRLNTSFNNQLWKKSRKRRHGPIKNGEIILDYDSSTTTVYGTQQGADRGRCFRKKDKPGFQPKFAFIGGLGTMIHHELCPQSRGLASDFDAFHRQTVARLPKTARIWGIRADDALYSENRIEQWSRKGYVYGVSAKRSNHLRSTIAAIPPEQWKDGIDADGHHYSIARISYKPATWTNSHTFIISRRPKDLKGQNVLWDDMKYEYFAFVTNHPGTAYQQFKFCVERCSLENFIKETKSGFRYDFLPSSKLDANRAYLGHVQLAYNLAIWWKLLDGPRPVNRWTIDTLRHRILNICGNIKRYAGRWVLSLPVWWPWQKTYRQLATAGGPYHSPRIAP
jgi:hypothetical protein